MEKSLASKMIGNDAVRSTYTFPETKADKAAAPDGSTTKPTSKAVKTADLGRQ